MLCHRPLDRLLSVGIIRCGCDRLTDEGEEEWSDCVVNDFRWARN